MATRVRHRKQLTVTLSEDTFAELAAIGERERLRPGGVIEQAVRLRALELRISVGTLVPENKSEIGTK